MIELSMVGSVVATDDGCVILSLLMTDPPQAFVR